MLARVASGVHAGYPGQESASVHGLVAGGVTWGRVVVGGAGSKVGGRVGAGGADDLPALCWVLSCLGSGAGRPGLLLGKPGFGGR
jgi:hypothetical protein